jgi:hypothetical protein
MTSYPRELTRSSMVDDDDDILGTQIRGSRSAIFFTDYLDCILETFDIIIVTINRASAPASNDDKATIAKATMKQAVISRTSDQDGAYLAKLLLDQGCNDRGSSRAAQISPFVNLQKLGVRDDVSGI